MQVREQDVDRAREGTRQLEPEQADAGAGIEDQRGVVGEHEREAGGVPAVADGLRAGAASEPRQPRTVAFTPGLPPRTA